MKPTGDPFIRESSDPWSAQTGERCEVSGLYEADGRHRWRKLVLQGQEFPCCEGACQQIVSWHLIRSIRKEARLSLLRFSRKAQQWTGQIPGVLRGEVYH